MKSKRQPKSPPRPAPPSAPVPRPANTRVNLQTRKVLSQHYRAKYGVK